MKTVKKTALRTLKGVRILSLALNMPGPAALMRCRQMGASCVKLEPPAPPDAPPGASGDPMSWYSPSAYAMMHEGVRVTAADLKTDRGQKALHREIARADLLLTSFRPSALLKLGLSWKALHRQYPALSQVAIVGAPGDLAEQPGHDLTYLAANDLITGLQVPATLYADMGGSLMASEAVLQAVMHKRTVTPARAGGVYLEAALSEAASYLALPRAWGLTKPGAAVGGGHAGYQVYKCKDGRVAVAALEPHFAARLCAVAGLEASGKQALLAKETQLQMAKWFSGKTRAELKRLAVEKDIPLYTLSK